MRRARGQFATVLATFALCVALCAPLVRGYTFTTFDNKECKGDPLNVTTVKQGECEVLSEYNPERPRSGMYVCEYGKLTTSVWIGSVDCGETATKDGVYLLEESQEVGASSLFHDTILDCSPTPWLENGNRWVQIDCSAGSVLTGPHQSFVYLLITVAILFVTLN